MIDESIKRGIYIPKSCPRGLKSCVSLAQIISTDGESFVCCGHNDGSTRKLLQDRFTVCFKNEELDECSDWDEQDMFDMQSVLAQAISADWHIKNNNNG